MLAHYSSDTFSTHIEYPSADLYSTYTMYSPADIRSDVLNDIMSSYYLHNYRIFGLNGLRYCPYHRPVTSDTPTRPGSSALVHVPSLEEDEDEDDSDSRDLDYLNPFSDKDEDYFTCDSCIGAHDCSCPLTPFSPNMRWICR